MKRSYRYRERDYSFGQTLMSLRTALGMTQIDLAAFLGISRRAVQGWEGGISYPTPEHLKRFVEQCLRQDAFPAGREEETIRALWQHPRQHMRLDETWLRALIPLALSPRATMSADASLVVSTTAAMEELQLQMSKRLDWLGALDVRHFKGREQEITELTRWMVQERCRLVVVLGMGGIGKSSLVSLLGQQVTPLFDAVLWRSLRDAPFCEELVADLVQALAPRPLDALPAGMENLLALLLEHLTQQRCLLVLDNLEVLLREGDVTGTYREGYEAYGRLLERCGESAHASCVLVTSREKPAELGVLEGRHSPVRTLRLVGLEEDACDELLREHHVRGQPEERGRLIAAYGGNPLALKIVSETIRVVFGGEIAPFLAEGALMFRGVRALLAGQFARLSPLEQSVLLWLAIWREPAGLTELSHLLAAPVERSSLLEAVEALARRSLIEQGPFPGTCTLQSVVLEYMTDVLIERVQSSLLHEDLQRLSEYSLLLAPAKHYVQASQQRVLVEPCLFRLRASCESDADLDERLVRMLARLRALPARTQGYGAALLLTLLRCLRGHLRSLNLSGLLIRAAALHDVPMQDTSLARALVRETSFTDALGVVYSVAVSPGRGLWAVGSGNGSLRVYRSDATLLFRIIEAHTARIQSFAFSPDDALLASCSPDGTIKLWDSERGTLSWTLRGHTGPVSDLAFSPDGRCLASTSDDGTLRLWDHQHGRCLITWVGHKQQMVTRVRWSRDGSRLASGGFDGVIVVWDMETGARTLQLTGHTGPISGLVFPADGTTLASSSGDTTIKLWDLTTGRLRQTLEGHTGMVRTLALRPQGDLLASGSYDGTIRLWDAESGSQRAVLLGHTSGVYALAFTPDGRRLLSGGGDNAVRVWDVEHRVCERLIQGADTTVYDIAWRPDSLALTCGSSDGTLTLWHVEDGRPVLRLPHPDTVRAVAWSPDGSKLASGSFDGRIRVWDVRTGTCLQVFDEQTNFIMNLAWSPDGTKLACGNWERTLRVWETATGLCCWVGVHGYTVKTVVWSPDGTRLASVSQEKTVRVWDTEGAMILGISSPGDVISVAWSPDGRYLVGGDTEGKLFLWEGPTGKLLHTWTGHSSEVGAVSWSPHSSVMVSTSDRTLLWWDSECWQCVHERRLPAEIRRAGMSPDGTLVASTSVDGLLRLWDASSAELVRTLRSDRLYERMDITGIQGLTQAQKESLLALGAVDDEMGA